MLNQFSRTQLLFGQEAMERLSRCRVAVFGIGGVGGYVVEALARSGIGALDLIDDDRRVAAGPGFADCHCDNRFRGSTAEIDYCSPAWF